VDGRIAGSLDSRPWWEASNLTLVIHLPYAAVSSVARVLGWAAPYESPSTVLECLGAVVAGEAKDDMESTRRGPATPVIAGAATGAFAILAILLGVFGWWLHAGRRRRTSAAAKYAAPPGADFAMGSLLRKPGSRCRDIGGRASESGSSEPLVKRMIMQLRRGSSGTTAGSRAFATDLPENGELQL